ncbi:unnamed protein product [Heterobilharzia americana]|nr:unnamed protein product [Heterobilharzia americana]
MNLALDDLVQESEKLLTEVQEDNDLPYITRSLDQMCQFGEKLHLSRGSNSDIKAARLLGPKLSYELPKNLSSKLEALVPTDSNENGPLVPETDIQSFLRLERENALVGAIHLTRKSLDCYLSLHLTPSADFTPIQNGVPRDLLTYLSRSHDSISREKQLKSQSKTSHSDIAEMWCFMKRIAYRMRSEHSSLLSYDRPLELRASSFVQNTLSLCALEHLEAEFLEFVKATVANQPRLARLGGRPGTRSLVRAYLSLRLPLESIPDDSFLNNSYQSSEFDDGLVDGVPVWPMLFYCLRTGDTQVTLEVAHDAVNNLGNFVNVLEEYVENSRRLRTPNQARFRQTCKHVIKSTRDPYKRLIYSILGQCDLNENHTDVVSNVDDFLWIKISQVIAYDPTEFIVASRSTTDDTVTLCQLQSLLYETYGELHFDAWSQPLIYFKILCLTQQYEAAIGFLARFEQLRCHAVHIALVFHDLHMLLMPNWLHSSLVSRNDCDPTGFRRLNLARLIMLYTRKFEITDPEKALMYYYMLSDISNPTGKLPEEESSTNKLSCSHNMSFDYVDCKGQNLFVQCVCELALASKELDLLLGCLGENDVRKPGAIDRYCKSTESRRELIRTVAHVFENSGQVIEAVRLYLLASSYGDPKPDILVAVALLNTVLSSVIITSDLGTTPLTQSRLAGQLDRSMLLRLASELAHKVRRLGISTDDNDYLLQRDVETDVTGSTWTTKILFICLILLRFRPSGCGKVAGCY